MNCFIVVVGVVFDVVVVVLAQQQSVCLRRVWLLQKAFVFHKKQWDQNVSMWEKEQENCKFGRVNVSIEHEQQNSYRIWKYQLNWYK